MCIQRIQQKHDIYSQTTQFRSDSGEHATFYEWYHWNIINNNDNSASTKNGIYHMNHHVNRCHGWELSKYDGIWYDGDGDVQFSATTVTRNGTKTMYQICTTYTSIPSNVCVRVYKYILSIWCRYQVISFFIPLGKYLLCTVRNKFSIFYFVVPFLAWIMLRHISKCSINV